MEPRYRIVFLLSLWIGAGLHHGVWGEELFDRVEHAHATGVSVW